MIYIQGILLALLWMGLTGEFSIANLILGLLVAALLLWLGRGVKLGDQALVGNASFPGIGHVVTKIGHLSRFLAIFIWEVIVANIDIALTVLSPNFRKMQPGIIALPLDVETDAEITMLANAITLTPGTLSLDVSDDRQVLYFHAVHAEDPETTRREIKQHFEQSIHEVYS